MLNFFKKAFQTKRTQHNPIDLIDPIELKKAVLSDFQKAESKRVVYYVDLQKRNLYIKVRKPLCQQQCADE